MISVAGLSTTVQAAPKDASAKRKRTKASAKELLRTLAKRMDDLREKIELADSEDEFTDTDTDLSGDELTSANTSVYTEVSDSREDTFIDLEDTRVTLSPERIAYISSDKWVKHRSKMNFCHLYVSLITSFPDTDTVQTQDHESDKKVAPNSDNEACIGVTEREAKKGKISMPNVNLNRHQKSRPPNRLRIINGVLHKEIMKITGIDEINYDHVSPFRSLVPFEAKFREALDAIEKKYEALISSMNDVDRDLVAVGDQKHLFQLLSGGLTYGAKRTTAISIIPEYLRDKALLRFLRDGLRALVHCLNTDLKEFVDTWKLIESGMLKEIPFTHLWFLFKPAMQIISTKPKDQVFQVIQAIGGRKILPENSGRARITNFIIDSFYLDFDGKMFRPVPKQLIILPYEGVRAITSLPAYPLNYDSEGKAKSLIERGKKFARQVQVTHRTYKGLSLKEGDLYSNYEEVDSDVIIDFELAYRNSNPKIQPPLFEGDVIVEPTEESLKECYTRELNYDNGGYYRKASLNFLSTTPLLDPQPIGKLGKDRYILLHYRVYGYVLLSRKWLPLDIDLVQDIKPVQEGDVDGFNDLVLPPGHRDVVRALVNTHARGSTTRSDGTNEQREFDLVKGKGRGLIILFHGAPGVGKTSTAECVAASTGRPLFPITCGDIGSDSAQEVERNLEGFFDLARKWGCVLLLDEADVFLGERTKGDIKQNSLVSVFLRVLEYYSGILILTTNRVGEFDEAIKSRVHCALYYPPLDKTNTLKVWKMNLDRLARLNKDPGCKKPVDFDRKEIVQFARQHWKAGHHWNGRQIKNAFQTAVALADWDYLKANIRKEGVNPLLETSHFKTVTEASAHFDRYLAAVRQSDTTRAKTHELRRDDFRDEDVSSVKVKSLEVHRMSTKPAWPELDIQGSTVDSSSDDSDESDDEFKIRRNWLRQERENKNLEEKMRAQQAKNAKKEKKEARRKEKEAAENERRLKEQRLRESSLKQIKAHEDSSDSDSE